MTYKIPSLHKAKIAKLQTWKETLAWYRWQLILNPNYNMNIEPNSSPASGAGVHWAIIRKVPSWVKVIWVNQVPTSTTTYQHTHHHSVRPSLYLFCFYPFMKPASLIFWSCTLRSRFANKQRKQPCFPILEYTCINLNTSVLMSNMNTSSASLFKIILVYWFLSIYWGPWEVREFWFSH